MKCKPLISRFLQITASFALICQGSCSKDSSVDLWGTGRIIPTVTVNPDVVVGSGTTNHNIIPDVPAPQDFSLIVSDLDGDYSHTWQHWTDYPTETGLRASRYKVQAFYGDSTREGFDAPWFHAARTVNVADGTNSSVDLDCSLANTMWMVNFSERMRREFTAPAVSLHSFGHSFVDYSSTETRPAFMMPGNTSVILRLDMPDGHNLDFVAADVSNVLPGHFYDLSIDYRELSPDAAPQIVLSFDEKISTDDVTIALTDEFINSETPVISTDGFTSGAEFTITEGADWNSPLSLSTPLDNLSALLLSYNSSSACFGNMPRETNLLNPTQAIASQLRECGIDISRTDRKLSVNFASMMPLLDSGSGTDSNSSFTLTAVSNTSKISTPCRFSVKVLPADITVKSISPAVVGLDLCQMEIESAVNLAGLVSIETYSEQGFWVKAPNPEITPQGNGLYTLRFEVPEGEAPVPVRLYYRNQLKFTETVSRIQPDFSIVVDPYALRAFIRIVPVNASLLSLITSKVNIFAGSSQVSVIDRNEESGIVTVAGLTDNTPYSFRASLFSRPDKESDFTRAVEVRTEKCAELTNGSFEDARQTLHYNNLLSGGRYSQSSVPIFNQQNKIQINLMTPKNWATVNDKTFCLEALNQNTWYMQPSAYIVTDSYNGGYAVKLTTTAWDVAGEAIPDYLQKEQPYVYYSLNIPRISHRAAGRLFLGSYTFNAESATETYAEGLDFTSRPSAVSGFYKYLPCTLQPSDKGIVVVEVLGSNGNGLVTIGSGRLLLTAAASYRAFSVPITYSQFAVKAKKLKIMFSSTENYGDIPFESSEIITFSDPVTSSSLGSELWIDEVSLSY